MIKHRFGLLIILFILGSSSCGKRTQEPESPEASTPVREIPLDSYAKEGEKDIERSGPNFKAIEGTTDYVLAEGVTDYAWLERKSQENGVTYLTMQKIPRDEVLQVTETTGPMKLARHRLDNLAYMTIEVPKEWELYSDESGFCDMDCDPSYDVMFRYAKKDGVKFEIAVTKFKSEEGFLWSVDVDKETSSQPSSNWNKERIQLENIEAELVNFAPDKLAKQSYGLTILSDFLVFKPEIKARVFRLLPALPRHRLMVYLALHGNNPSKEDLALARQVILSFRYHENP